MLFHSGDPGLAQAQHKSVTWRVMDSGQKCLEWRKPPSHGLGLSREKAQAYSVKGH